MEEMLDEVFLKESNEMGQDRVVILKNVPRRLFYRLVPKMIQKYDRDGYTDGTLTPDPSGEKVYALLEGMRHSKTGDGAIVVDRRFEDGKFALQAIDAYIAGTLPRDIVIPQRVPYAIDPTNTRSMPRPRTLIPVIELPKPIKTVSSEVSPAGNAAPQTPVAIKVRKPRKPMTEEQKQASRERLAKAREKIQQLKKAE